MVNATDFRKGLDLFFHEHNFIDPFRQNLKQIILNNFVLPSNILKVL